MARLRRAEQVERNRQLVLSAARQVFLLRGYGGTTLEAVAEEAGFSKGVVYSRFGSKADLFFALLEQRIQERGSRNERVAAELTGAEAVRELMRVAAQDARAEEGWARLLVEFRALASRDPELSRRYAAAHAQTVQGLAEILDRIHERAGADPAVPLSSMAEFILALGAGITLERAANPAALPDGDVIAMLPAALGLSNTAEPAGLADG